MKAYSGIIKLICLFVLAPLVIWKFALGGTFSLYTEKQKAERLNQSVPLPVQTSGQAVLPASSEPLLSNGKFLRMFSDTLAARQVEVISYTPEMIDAEENYKLYCGRLLLSGGYIELVKVVSVIENSSLPLKIASMSFEYDRRKRDAPKKVLLSLLMEQIEVD